MSDKTTLLIMAAGLGSRYGGDKQVDGIGPRGEILMQYSIYDAIAAGFDKIVFVIKREHRAIIEGFCQGIKGVEIEFVCQDFSSIPEVYAVPAARTKPFGTVHAVLCAKGVIAEPFAIINADDYYGAEAFRVIHGKLSKLGKGEGAMVAYRLKNTVSQNGGVTRGVCDIRNGVLAGIKEVYNITVDSDGIIRDAEAGELCGDTLVSMNMWGFTPSVFDLAQESFIDFLSKIPDGDIKAEYALPTMIDKLICGGLMRVAVLPTDSVWFGVTYKEDKASVTEKLLEMHRKGIYPDKLF